MSIDSPCTAQWMCVVAGIAVHPYTCLMLFFLCGCLSLSQANTLVNTIVKHFKLQIQVIHTVFVSLCSSYICESTSNKFM